MTPPTPALGPSGRFDDAKPISLILAALVFVVAIAGLELAGAARGIQPAVPDSPLRWARVYDELMATPDAIALVGSSRTALGVDPQLLEAAIGRPVFNLAINGGNPLPVLERLAADGFTGPVVVEFMEVRYFSADADARASATKYIDVLDSPSLVADGESRIDEWISERLRSRSQALQLLSLVRALAAGGLPRPPTRVMRADRFETTRVGDGNYSGQAQRWVRRILDSEPYAEHERREVLAQIRSLGSRSRARGGNVYFVRLPSTGDVAAAEAEMYPRPEAFQRLAQEVIHGWHYADQPATAGLRCFDGSHLDPRDVATLTTSIGEWVRGELDSFQAGTR